MTRNESVTLTLILMSVLIAMATQIIGDNIARAFSLVGALSIVCFRTAVPATRDVAFVLAAVVVGMAIGAGQYWVAALGLIVVGLATKFNAIETVSTDARSSKSSNASADDKSATWRFTLEVGLSATDGWESELNRFCDCVQLTSAETTRRGSAMQMVYRTIPKEDSNLADVIAALNLLPMVESVAAKAV